MFICSRCIDQHTKRPGDHCFFSIKAAAAVSSNSEKCDVCQAMPAAQACGCVFPLPALCIGCKIIHSAQSSRQKQHLFLPLEARQDIHSSEELSVARRNFMGRSLVNSQLQQNVAAMEVCEAAIARRCDDIDTALEAHRDQNTRLLRLLKQAVDTAVDRGLGQVRSELANLAATRYDEVAEMIVKYLESGDEKVLCLFRYLESEKSVDLENAVAVKWECRIDEAGEVVSDFKVVDEQMAQPKAAETPNVLSFDTVDSSLQSCKDETQRTLYYKHHFACLQATHEALTQTQTAMSPKSSFAQWQSYGEELIAKKIGRAVPPKYKDMLAQMLQRMHELKKEMLRQEERQKALVAKSGRVQDTSEKVPPRRPGRPRKDKSDAPTKKLKRALDAELQELVDKD